MPVHEQEVSQIWANALGLPEADINANFFDLGGNSLVLLELISLLNQELGIETDVLTLLEYPTVATFTSYWNSLETADNRNH